MLNSIGIISIFFAVLLQVPSAPALLLLLPLGLILLISSAMPEDQAPATAIQLLLTWSVAALAYFGVGFALQFGGIAQVSPNPGLSGLYWEWYPLDPSVEPETARLWGMFALQGWALTGAASTPEALRLFVTHLTLVGMAAIIPVGALPRRGRGGIALLIGLITGALIYPISGNWLWGGGWLAHLGISLGLGHGLVDFGGASIIFLTGSMVVLMALLLLKPVEEIEEPEEIVVSMETDSLAVYTKDEEREIAEEILAPVPMPSAYLPILSMLGAGLIFIGWFGLAMGLHVPTALNFSPALAATNGLLAALSSTLAAAGYSWFTTLEWNPLMSSRGLLAGLVIALAGAPFIPPWIMVIAGLLMGLLLPLLIYFVAHKLSLPDEMGALATYGASAIFSLLLVAFFADGQAGQGWNSLGPVEESSQGVSGLWIASSQGYGQLQAQLLGMAMIALLALILSYLLFQGIKAVTASWQQTGFEITANPLARFALPKKHLDGDKETN